MKNIVDNSSKKRSIRVLFLSFQASHEKIFLNIINELEKKSDVSFTILNSKDLLCRPFSARLSYMQEIRNYRQIVDDIKPDVFVVGNDQGIAGTFIRICNLRGIPSVVIQDGILLNKRLEGLYLFLAWKTFLPWRLISIILNSQPVSSLALHLGRQWWAPDWGMGNATVIVVMGNYYKRVVAARGIRSDKIFVTGYPLLDDFLKKPLNAYPSDDFKQRIMEDKKPIILLITQPLVEDGLWEPSLHVLHFDSVVTAVKHVNGKLIVKVHPRENIEAYQILATKYSEVSIMVTKDYDVDQLILSSDAVITVNSTVGLWAMAYHKPLLVTNYFPQANIENILEKMGLPVNKRNDLPVILNQILRDETFKDELLLKQSCSLQEHLHYLDGCASMRIANLVISVAKSSK